MKQQTIERLAQLCVSQKLHYTELHPSLRSFYKGKVEWPTAEARKVVGRLRENWARPTQQCSSFNLVTCLRSSFPRRKV